MLAIPARVKWEIAGALVALLAIGLVWSSLAAARKEAAALRVTLASEKTVVVDAAKREATRDEGVKTAVAKLEEGVKRTQTPVQAIRALPAVIPLPVPITLSTPQPGAKPTAPGELPDAPVANLPVADLKPLYDFGVACQECKLELAAAKADRADDALKLTAVTKERDAAVNAAKGGTKWQILKRSAKWLAIGVAVGAGAGAVAVCASGHCK
jgi:hypothetical protein